MNELVSIVTTLYNYAHYLPSLADSVLRQTYSNWYWIIVDDFSEDNPLKVLRPLLNSKLSHRIKYIKLKNNYGYSIAKNEGIRASRGDYIAML